MFMKENANSKHGITFSMINRKKYGINKKIHFPNSSVEKLGWSYLSGIVSQRACDSGMDREVMNSDAASIVIKQDICHQKEHLIPKLCHQQIVMFSRGKNMKQNYVMFIFHCSVVKISILEPDCLSSDPNSPFYISVTLGESINVSISHF